MISKLKQKLFKTHEGIIGKINATIKSRKEIDEDLFDELEEILIGGDLGVDLSLKFRLKTSGKKLRIWELKNLKISSGF